MDPAISVLLVTFNHRNYIQHSIESILNQTYTDFELIIVDDGSTDGTKKIIDQYNDKRIRKVFKTNEGPSSALNVGMKLAKSNWIALMSGDDISYPNRLSIELDYVENFKYNICFGLPDIIDDRGITKSDKSFPVFFEKVPEKKEMVFKRLLEKGNYLCAPTVLFNKEIVKRDVPFLDTSLQLQDFELWLNIAKNYDIPVIQKRLIQYRVHDNNLSSSKNDSRTRFEMEMIYNHVLDDMNWNNLHNLFPECFTLASSENENLFKIEKALLLLKQKNPLIHYVGCTKLWNYMQNIELRNLLASNYNFKMLDFFKATK